MSVALWTLIVIFVPNAIGFILYFLLRQPLIYFLLRWPLLINCPQCGATLNPSFNHCPKCKFNLHPTCPECKHAVQTGDAFCPYCARGLKGATTQ
jgi:predicted amidophosphoribosyltransferase